MRQLLGKGDRLMVSLQGLVRIAEHLIEQALKPYLGARQKKRSRHLARVLWSSVYGISSLGALGKLAAEESQVEMTKTLIKAFVIGIRADS